MSNDSFINAKAVGSQLPPLAAWRVTFTQGFKACSMSGCEFLTFFCIGYFFIVRAQAG